MPDNWNIIEKTIISQIYLLNKMRFGSPSCQDPKELQQLWPQRPLIMYGCSFQRLRADQLKGLQNGIARLEILRSITEQIPAGGSEKKDRKYNSIFGFEQHLCCFHSLAQSQRSRKHHLQTEKLLRSEYRASEIITLMNTLAAAIK